MSINEPNVGTVAVALEDVAVALLATDIGLVEDVVSAHSKSRRNPKRN